MKKFLFRLGALVIALVAIDVACAFYIRTAEGRWIYRKQPNFNLKLFEPHDDLVGMPRKNISKKVKGIHYAHNEDGFRDNAFPAQKKKKRILCIGGSTTYGIGVSNHETYPHYLDSLLQPGYEVFNLGVPGHNSVEHKKLLPEAIEKYHPEIILLHAGLNDLRCMNVHHLKPDYSNFHAPSLYRAFGFCLKDRLPRSGTVHTVYRLYHLLYGGGPGCYSLTAVEGTVSDSSDAHVVKIFSENLDTFARQCLSKNIRIVLIPQVLSEEALTDDNLKWWAPFLTKKGIFNGAAALNRVMNNYSETDANIRYLDHNAHLTWEKTDFFDPSHLNAKGNLKLAKLTAQFIHQSFAAP